MRYYEIRIFNLSECQIEHIDIILGIRSSSRTGAWFYTIEESENDPSYSFIDNFLTILDGKYQQLEGIGVSRNLISFWFLYEYDEQCNIEFAPDEIEKMGKEGISLCISCWEK